MDNQNGQNGQGHEGQQGDKQKMPQGQPRPDKDSDKSSNGKDGRTFGK